MPFSSPERIAASTAASVRSPLNSAPDNQGDLFPLEVRTASPGWIAPIRAGRSAFVTDTYSSVERKISNRETIAVMSIFDKRVGWAAGASDSNEAFYKLLTSCRQVRWFFGLDSA